MATSGENQTLVDVDESLVQVGVFLEDIANSPRKVECLDTFVVCKKIVNWLQKETKSKNIVLFWTSSAVHTCINMIFLHRCERDSALCECGFSYSCWWRGRSIT